MVRSKREPSDSLTPPEMEGLRNFILKRHARDEIINEEVALALAVAESIHSKKLAVDDAYNRFKFVFQCLLDKHPKLVLAREARLQLQFDVYRHSGFFTRTLARLSSGSSLGVVLLALVASMVFWLVFAIIVRVIVDTSFVRNLFSDVFFMNGRALAVVSSAALIGGVISIATRLREFSRVRDLDPAAMFWTATLKPLIGVVLSWFLLAALGGDIMSFGFLGNNPLGLSDDNATPELPDKVMYVFWVLGFLAGFSERFAWDFIDRTQRVVTGDLAAADRAVAAAATATPPPPKKKRARPAPATATKSARKKKKKRAPRKRAPSPPTA